MLKNILASNNTDSEQLKLLEQVRESLNISEEVHKELEAKIISDLQHLYDTEPLKDVSGNDLNLLVNIPDTGSTAPASEASAAEAAPKAPAISMAPTGAMTLSAPKVPTTPPPPVAPKALTTPSPLANKVKSEILKNVKIKKYLTLGKDKYCKKDYERALNFFTKAQNLTPNNEELQFLIKKVKLKIKHAKPKKKESVNENFMNLEVNTPKETVQTHQNHDSEYLSTQTQPKQPMEIPVENPYSGSRNTGPPAMQSKEQSVAPVAIPVGSQHPYTNR